MEGSRLAWAQGVGGSNPLAPTIFNSLAILDFAPVSEPYQNQSDTDDRNKIEGLLISSTYRGVCRRIIARRHRRNWIRHSSVRRDY